MHQRVGALGGVPTDLRALVIGRCHDVRDRGRHRVHDGFRAQGSVGRRVEVFNRNRVTVADAQLVDHGRVRGIDQGEGAAENTRPHRLEQLDCLMVRSGAAVKCGRSLALTCEVRVAQFDGDLGGNRVGRTVECQRAEAVRARRKETEDVPHECGAIVRRRIGFGHGIQREGEEHDAPAAVGPKARIAQPSHAARRRVVENRSCIRRNCQRVRHVRGLAERLPEVIVIAGIIQRQAYPARDRVVVRTIRHFHSNVLIEGLNLEDIRTEGHVAEPRQYFHRGNEQRPATVQISLQRCLFCWRQTGVTNEASPKTVVYAPDNDSEWVEVVRARRATVAYHPRFVTQAGLIERVGVGCLVNNRARIVGKRLVAIDKEHRLRRRGNKAEQRAAVVVRRDIARLVRRDDEELVVRSREQIVQLNLMGSFQDRAGRRERKVAIGAVTNDGRGRYVGCPPNDCFAELVGFRNVRQHRRHEVGSCRGGAWRRRPRVLIGGLDGVAVCHLQAPVGNRSAGDRCHSVGEHAERTRRHECEQFPVCFGGTGDEDVNRGLSGQVRVDQLDFDHIRRAIGPAVEEQHTHAWQRQITGHHQREILVHCRRINARVFDHVAGAHTHDVFPRQRRAQADGFDVVNIIVARRIGHRLAFVELVAAINSAVRRFHFKVEIVDQRWNSAGKPWHVRVGEGDFQWFVRTGDHDAMGESLANGQKVGLIDELKAPWRTDDLRQVDAAPAFIVVRYWPRAAFVVHIDRRIDQCRFDQCGRRRRIAMELAIVLHEHGRRARSVRARLARAALVLVEIVDAGPRVLVRRRFGLQRRDPGPRRRDIRLDAAVFTRPTAGKIRHRFLAIRVNKKVEPIVFGCAGGNDVLANRRAVDGLRAGTGIAGGKFQDVRLVAGCGSVRVAYQTVKFHRAQIVAALNVVAPTVRPDHRASADGIACQRLVARRRLKISRAIENSLHHDVRAGSDTQAVEEAAFVRLAGGRVGRDDARHVRPVAMLIRRVLQGPVINEFVHATRQIGMHRLRVAVVQAGVGHGDFDAAAVEAQLLRHRARADGAVISAHDLGGNLINQLWFGLRFNP